MLPLVVHLLPIWPLLLERTYLTLAAVLMVTLFYIKSKKITVQLENDTLPETERVNLERTLQRWKQFTFMR